MAFLGVEKKIGSESDEEYEESMNKALEKFENAK